MPFLSSFRYNKKGYISKQQGGLRLDSGEKRDIPVRIDGEIKQHFPGLPERGQVSANDFGTRRSTEREMVRGFLLSCLATSG